MTRLTTWLEALQGATGEAERVEKAFREEAARRIAHLAEERAFAYRRANLIRAVGSTVASAEDEETAVAHGVQVLRNRLGWSEVSEARTEIGERFQPVCAVMFAALGDAEDADPSAELAAFEAWYAETRGSAFWKLFETYIPETPLVDF